MKSSVFRLRPAIAALLFFTSLAPCAFSQEGPATRQGIEEYNRENYEEALQLLLKARSSEGSSPINYYYSGLSRKEAGDYQEAVIDFTAALHGVPPYKQAVTHLISALCNLERYDEAMQWVSWAEREGVSPKEVSYLKGQLLAREKRYDEAIAAFDAARNGNEETDQQVGLQIASAHAQNSRFKEAREALQTLISRNPNSDAATFAREYDQKLSALKPAKNWNFFLGVNYQYDDNVTTANTGRQGDSGISENLRAEYDALLTGPWSLNAQYSISNNNYLRLLSRSILSQNLSVTPGYRSGNHVVTLPASLTYSNLDTTSPPSHARASYKNYSLQTTIRPTDTYLVNQNQLFQGSLSYSNRQMLHREPLGSENRDGHLFGGHLGYIHLFADGNGMFNLRGEIVYEDTSGRNWTNLGERIGADLLLPLTESTRLILSSEAFFQNYQNKNSIFAIKRNDTTVNGSIAINRQLTPLVYLNLQYSFTRALSNIYVYDYQRNLISSGLEVRF